MRRGGRRRPARPCAQWVTGGVRRETEARECRRSEGYLGRTSGVTRWGWMRSLGGPVRWRQGRASCWKRTSSTNDGLAVLARETTAVERGIRHARYRVYRVYLQAAQVQKTAPYAYKGGMQPAPQLLSRRTQLLECHQESTLIPLIPLLPCPSVPPGPPLPSLIFASRSIVESLLHPLAVDGHKVIQHDEPHGRDAEPVRERRECCVGDHRGQRPCRRNSDAKGCDRVAEWVRTCDAVKSKKDEDLRTSFRCAASLG
jgi:hypothetical protein